jgi:carbon-monoxide dehydrogenase iron sulfur subunit
MKKIKVDSKKCSGCRLCMMNCSFQHFNVSAPHLSNVRILGSESHAEFNPTVCRQCSGRFCVKSCPHDALSISDRTGAVQIDHDKCELCGACISACPFNCIYISINPQGEKMLFVCDLCGGDPQCVRNCRLGALQFV